MYEVVKSKVVTTKWIVTEKEEGRSCKVRLVARGFEDVEMEAKHAPKFSGGSLKMVSVVIGKCGWKCISMYAIAAYLQKEKMKRTVHLKSPKRG